MTLVAIAALLCAAGPMVFANSENATGGGKPKLVVREISETSQGLDDVQTYEKVLKCPIGTKAISSSHDIHGGSADGDSAFIEEDGRQSRREWRSTLFVHDDGTDWTMHLYCARVR